MEFIKPNMGTIIFTAEEIALLEKAYNIVYDFCQRLGIYADIYDDDGKCFRTNADVRSFRDTLGKFVALAEQDRLRYQKSTVKEETQ